MPKCIGKSLEEVTGMLSEMGINFQLVPNYSAEHEYNVVYNQSVEAETEVAVGDRMNKVFIYYGALEPGKETSSSYNDKEDENKKPSVTIIDGLG